MSDELVAEIRRLLGLPAAENDEAAQDAVTAPGYNPAPVAPLNGRQLLDGAASALRSPGSSVTVNAPAGAAEALRWHIANQQQ